MLFLGKFAIRDISSYKLQREIFMQLQNIQYYFKTCWVLLEKT